jgi:hypothetical protein
MEAKRTHFSTETRRVAVELWKAKVPMKKNHGAATDVKRRKLQVQVLNMDNSQYLRNLVEFMPKRLQDVIITRATPTKYLLAR